MIISHKHKFIFIHIPKCAGSTISHVLLNYLYYPFHKKCCMFNNLKPEVAQVFKEFPDQGNSYELKQHSKFIDLEKYFLDCGLNVNDYFKFSFMRNPWERQVSHYYDAQKIARKKNPCTDITWAKEIASVSFKEYILKIGADCQLKYVTKDNGKIGVDFLGSGKNIQEDFDIVSDKIGINSTIDLPHNNATKHKHYTEYYDDETRNAVAKKFAKDIEYFGYEYGE